MKFNKKDLFYQFLFFLCIAISYQNSYELTFLVWGFTILLTLKKRYSFTLVRHILFFGVILFLALIPTFFHSYQPFSIIRDTTYFLKPILGLIVGYQLCKSNSQKALNTFIYIGLFIAIIHLIKVLVAVMANSSVTVNVIRDNGGFFSDFEIYVLIILIFSKKFEIAISKMRLLILMLVIGFSCFLYLSRTNVIQLVILIVAIKGYFVLNVKSLKIIGSVLISVLLAYSAIYYINPKRNGKGLEAFLYKIKIAPIEPFKTKIDVDNWKDLNDNFRSYESITVVKQVSKKGIFAVCFGEGLGSTLNLGREMLSNDGEIVQFIPIVHNAYMTVFFKTGILGVLIYISYMFFLGRQKKSNINLVQQINYLLLGTAVYLIFSNWVFLGVYLKLDNKSIVIGFLLCLRQFAIAENKRTITKLENEGSN